MQLLHTLHEVIMDFHKIILKRQHLACLCTPVFHYPHQSVIQFIGITLPKLLLL